jgi:hypothetical protein
MERVSTAAAATFNGFIVAARRFCVLRWHDMS